MPSSPGYENLRKRLSILETRAFKCLQTEEQRRRVLISCWNLDKIVRINSSGSSLNLSTNLVDRLNPMLVPLLLLRRLVEVDLVMFFGVWSGFCRG